MKPESVGIFTFNVGFGDCFLIRFSYPGNAMRHVLIDFGSTRAPKGAGDDHLKLIANKIRELCGGQLDIIVATHRHKDHISGFATTAGGDGSGDVIAALNPKLVVQPWTEDPDIQEDAKAPAAGSHAFTQSLAGMNSFAASLHEFAQSLSDDDLDSFDITPRERDFLSFVGENNVSNKSAVKNLIAMGKKGKALYLHAGNRLNVASILPGVKIHVLGPPTVEQLPDVAKQRAKNEAEYWHLMATDSAAPAPAATKRDPLFPDHIEEPVRTYAKWTRWRLKKLRKEMLFPIVTALDNAMNNTSLILLFQVGEKSFLFPGDAQWENWQFALSQPEWVSMLEKVDVYKVGHHGSLNATPKTLWKAFERKGPSRKPDRLTSLMSTMHDVHGHTEETAVPRSTLVDALKKDSNHHSTEDIANGLFEEIQFGV